MSLLKAYLNAPRTRQLLAKKPGQAGFSLIELVVVVAVLAVLAAIALPNFLGVNRDAQIAATKNTLANIVKECSVRQARGQTTGFSDAQAAAAKLNGYQTLTAVGTSFGCMAATATPESGSSAELPTLNIIYSNGITSKGCTVPSGKAATDVGCIATAPPAIGTSQALTASW